MIEQVYAESVAVDAAPKRQKARRKNDRLVITDMWAYRGERRGQRWQYRVFDWRLRKYRTKSFSEAADEPARRGPGCRSGDSWAADTAAKLQLGLDSAASASLRDVGELYVLRLKDLNRSKSRLRIVEVSIERAIAAGIIDLKDECLPDRTQHWLARLQAQRHGQKLGRPATARTKNAYLLALRSIANFAVRRRILTHNPFLACDLFAEPRRFRKVYEIDELRRIVSDEHRSNPFWIFVVLAAYTGLRSATISALTWDMVDWKANRIRVPAEITKTDMDVRVPLQPELREILQASPGVGSRRIYVPPGSGTSDRSNELMQKYLRLAKVEPNGRSVHCFRHTVASLLTASGMTPYLVMDAVGHASMATSKHYSRGADEYREQIRAEGWGEGEFFFRRPAPKAQGSQTAAM